MVREFGERNLENRVNLLLFLRGVLPLASFVKLFFHCIAVSLSTNYNVEK